jgi:hypothetical protein
MATTRTVTVKTSGGDYTSLSAALSGEAGNLVTLDRLLVISCYNMQDTTAATISGFTTDSTRYVKIVAAEKHNGKWSTAGYRLVLASGNPLNIDNGYTVLEDIQIHQSGSDRAITGWMTAVSSFKCYRCIIRGNNAMSYDGMVMLQGYGAGASFAFYNCIFYDTNGGGYKAIVMNTGVAADFNVFNCTFQNVIQAIYLSSSVVHYIKNNLVKIASGGSSFSGLTDNDANCDYNFISENYNDPACGSHGGYNKTFTFVDEAGDDFHLASTDTGAIDVGNTYSSLYTDDIDGVTRSGTWDVGADEYVAAAAGTPIPVFMNSYRQRG